MKSGAWLLIGVLAGVSGCATSAVRDQPPPVAGQPAPNQHVVLDFTKRYDLHCREGTEIEKMVLANCRILGYTGDSVRDATGKTSYDFDQFGRWLVIEQSDGRKIFLPPRMILYLEDAK